jgi:hypothetical protein
MKTPPPAPHRDARSRPSSTSTTSARNRWLLPVFILLALVGGGLAWREHNKNQELEARLAQAASRPTPTRPIPAPRAPAPAPVLAGELPPLPAEQPAPEPAMDRQQQIAAFSQLLSNPLVQNITNNLARGAVDRAYNDLFAQLNLTAEQDGAMRDLLAQRMTAGRDALAAATAQGIDPQASPDQFQSLVKQAQAPIDQNIRATLGDEASFQTYQSYQATVDANPRLNPLRRGQ